MSQERSTSSFASSIIAKRYGQVDKKTVRKLALEEIEARAHQHKIGFPTLDEPINADKIFDRSR